MMKPALERITSWISSCVSYCLGSADDNRYQQQEHVQEKGQPICSASILYKMLTRHADIKDINICHTQPQLIQPMRLSIFNSNSPPHPSGPRPSLQRPQRTHSLPPHAMERNSIKTLPSRRSSLRASIPFRRKSTAGPIRISAPSDFRRVQSSTVPECSGPKNRPFQFRVQFHPLELSIYNAPGHWLSDLPSFDDFNFENEDDVVKRPQKTLSFPMASSLPHRSASTASYSLPRKPVGSGISRRTSSATTFEHWPSSTANTSNPLIPHFATINRSSTTRPHTSAVSGRENIPLPRIRTLQNRPTLRTEMLSIHNTSPTSPPPPASTITETSSSPTSPSKSGLRRHSRTRTLSGSTLASCCTQAQAQTQSSSACKHVSSPSMNTEDIPTSTSGSSALEKGSDASLVAARPCTAAGAGAVDDRIVHPTIYEGEQMVHNYGLI